MSVDLDDILESAEARLEALGEGGDGLTLERAREAEATALEVLSAYGDAVGGQPPPEGDLLAWYETLLVRDPSFRTLGETVRTLVYLRNCVLEGRPDALPERPGAVLTTSLRHLVLMMRSRCEQERRLG